jgi:UDP-2,3-diacylglucosamine pyrophosphatase LpxH
MKIVGISDLHGWLPQQLPEGDVLCIAGDIVPLKIQRDMKQSMDWFYGTFSKWIDSLSYKHVIIVPGNHDFYIEELFIVNELELFDDYFNEKVKPEVHWIIDGKVEIDGTTFYGCAWTNENEHSGPGRWAFEAKREEGSFRDMKYYGLLRARADVIITHDSPRHNHTFNHKDSDDWQLWLHGHWHDDKDIPLVNVHNVAVLKNNYSPKGGGFKVFNINQENDEIREIGQQEQIVDEGDRHGGSNGEQEEKRVPLPDNNKDLSEHKGDISINI